MTYEEWDKYTQTVAKSMRDPILLSAPSVKQFTIKRFNSDKEKYAHDLNQTDKFINLYKELENEVRDRNSEKYASYRENGPYQGLYSVHQLHHIWFKRRKNRTNV